MRHRIGNLAAAVVGWFLDTMVGVFAMIVGLVIGVCWLVNIFLLAPACERTADLYQLDHHYTWLTGCNVLVDGEYRSIDNVRVVIDK